MVGRIAVLIPTLGDERPEQTGGAERNAVNVARMLREQGVEVDMVLFRAVGHYLSRVPEGVRIVDLRVRRPYRIVSAITSVPWRLAKYMGKHRPTAVLSFDNRASVAAVSARALARSRTRVIGTIRSTLSMRWRDRKSALGRLAFAAVLRMTYARLDALAAVSEGVAADLVVNLGLSPGKISVVHNPIIDHRLFVEAEELTEDPWFDDKRHPVVLSVGRLAEPKDFGTVIDAIAIVRRSRPVRLVILGEGSLRSELEAQVSALGLHDDVRLPGFAANPYSYMRRADVFVLSSRSEGLPGVLIEAMACGVSVISTDCPHGPREVLEGGRWGELVPAGNATAMARAIEAALDQPRPAPPESWHRFTHQAAKDRYLALLLGKEARAWTLNP